MTRKQKQTSNKKLLILSGLVLLFLMTAFVATRFVKSYKVITVKASVLNVRQGPGLSYETMTQINKGQKITVLNEKNNWYQVRLKNEKVGWVASWLVKNTEISAHSNRIGVINQTPTNVRQTASLNAKILTTLTKDTQVTVTYKQAGWTQVLFNNQIGWIKNELITVTNQTPTTNTTNDKQNTTTNAKIKTVTTQQDNTKLRQGPGTTYDYDQVYSANTKLTYLKTSGKWYQVKDQEGHTGYVASWIVLPSNNENTIKSDVSSLAEATIVLDAGHGGNDVGALSIKNKYEKKYTLQTVKKIASQLKKAGANVILTRSDDEYVTLTKRHQISNENNADAFISIHFDSSPKDNEASGTTTYYYSEKDSKLAKKINTQLVKLPLENRGVDYGNFQVLRNNQRPSVLLELGYINSQKDFKQISDADYQTAIANAVFVALNQYF